MIHTAFGDKYSPEERKGIARRAYRNIVRTLIDFLRYPILSRDDLLDLCDSIEGWEHLEKALVESPGAVIGLSGHIGSWEYSGAILPNKGVPLAAVGREQRENAITKLMIESRTKVGIDHIPRSKYGNRKLIKSFRTKGTVVGLLSDQNGGRNGIFVPFFGKMASTVRGPAFFALRYNVPIVPIFAVWEGLKYKILILEPVEIVHHEDEEEAIRLTSINIQKVYERVISEYPDQWMWVHDRWKTRPPGEAAESP
jgi:KDO2-lipid IV(A) lauroyltransferase